MEFYLLAILLCGNALLRTVIHYVHYHPDRAQDEDDWWKMALLGVDVLLPARREQ